MNAHHSTSWLFDLWRRRRDGSEADAADVGTAFGLELTLIPEDDAPAPPARHAAGGRPRWWRRWMRRQPAT